MIRLTHFSGVLVTARQHRTFQATGEALLVPDWKQRKQGEPYNQSPWEVG